MSSSPISSASAFSDPSASVEDLVAFGPVLRIANLLSSHPDAVTDRSRFESAVEQMLRTAVDAMPGAAAASISQSAGPHWVPRVVAATDPAARSVDQLQTELSEGPSYEVCTGTFTERMTTDLSTDTRWPTLSAGLPDLPGSLGGAAVIRALPASADRRIALTIYADRRANGALAGDNRTVLMIETIALAFTALMNAHEAAHLAKALQSNRRIGVAMGVLLAQHRCTERQAFELLRDASQRTNTKIKEIVENVVLTGQLPGGQSAPGPTASDPPRNSAVSSSTHSRQPHTQTPQPGPTRPPVR